MPTNFTTPTTGTLQGAPVAVGVTTQQGALPDLEPSPKFLFFHHPSSWYVAATEDGPELLPQLSACAVEAGVGRVDRYGDPAGLIGHKTSRGWTMIPEGAATGYTPDGAPGYCRAIKGRRGTMHVSAWTSVKVLAGRPSMVSDDAGYHRWLRSLTDRGIIAPPSEEIVLAKLESARERLGRAAQRSSATVEGSIDHRLAEQARANVEALETLADPSASVPKKAPRAKKGGADGG